MATLSEHPVLFLAIDNLSKMSSIDEKQLSTIWNLFTKCKDNLENGRRLENISWRLWYRSTHFPVPNLEKNSTQMSTSFSKVLSAPFKKEMAKENLPMPLIESLELLSSHDNISTQPNILHSETDMDTSQSLKISLPQVLQQDQTLLAQVTESFMLNEKVLLEEIVDQEMMMDQEESREYTGNVQKKATFFVSDSCSGESYSVEMKRDTGKEDDETDFSEEDDDGFSYSTDWSWTPSPLFSKIPLQDLKEPIITNYRSNKKSLLSCALHTKDQTREVSKETVHMHLSSSMKQTLIWDRCMPFNTKYAKDRPMKDVWRTEDTAEYW